MSQAEPSESTDAGSTLKLASMAEAATLAVLVLVAVPLKHLAEVSIATRVMGPIHGVAFLLYLWALMRSAAEGGWRFGEVVRMIVVACIPLAGFMNQPWLARKIRETQTAAVQA
jgi:integral membrane protein